MRRVWQAAAFLFAVFFFSLIYKLPAKFVYQQFAKDSPVQLVGVSGSIWSGHAEQIVTQQLSLERLDWKLSPLSLLLGEVDIDWTLDDSAALLSGEIILSSSQQSLKNTRGHIDLLAMAQRLPQQEILLGGIVQLDIAKLDLEQNKITNAVGKINWNHAELLSPENIVLGGFKTELSANAGELIMQLSDTGGAASLSGNASLSAHGKFKFSMQIGVRDTSATGLLGAFNQLGPTDENGKVKLSGREDLF